MAYLFRELVIEKNTSRALAMRTLIPLAKGVINRIDITFPDGCLTLARIIINYHGSQLIPFNLDSSLGYNNHVLEIPCNIEVDQAPFELEVLNWNLDDTFSHTLLLGIVINYANEVSNPTITKATPINTVVPEITG